MTHNNLLSSIIGAHRTCERRRSSGGDEENNRQRVTRVAFGFGAGRAGSVGNELGIRDTESSCQ